MNSAPNSQPIRHASRHWRGWPVDNMMVNSAGMSRYSAITFTPPADTSVIVQSRGNEPAANRIFATLLHRRRSLLRRFSNMSILRLARWFIPHLQPFYRTIIGIRIAGSLAMYLFSLNSFYRVPQTLSRNARECHKCRSKNPALQVSRLNAEMLSCLQT